MTNMLFLLIVRFTNDRDRDRDRDTRDRDRDSRNSFGGGGRRNYNNDRDSLPPAEPKTRQKLNLKPRTLPIEDNIPKDGK